MAINGKRKGNAAELELSKILTKQFGEPFARVGASSGARVKNTKTLSDTAKSVMTSDIICPQHFRFSVECKSVAASKNWWWFADNAMIDSFLNQVTGDAQSVNKIPLLCVKVPNRGWIAAISVASVQQEIDLHKIQHAVMYRDWLFLPLDVLFDCLEREHWFEETGS
jgi:hypothetical protein